MKGEAHTVIGEGLFEFTKGFWINADCKFTRAQDGRYWIPASQILCIERIKVNGN
jgi:hypothetical protein